MMLSISLALTGTARAGLRPPSGYRLLDAKQAGGSYATLSAKRADGSYALLAVKEPS